MFNDLFFTGTGCHSSSGQYPFPRDRQRLTTDEDWKWYARSVFCGCLCYVVGVVLALVLCALLGSCATQKTEHEQQTHVVQADTTATESSHSVHVTQRMVNIDSIVTAVMKRTREEIARQEREHETVTETLTETIDSLGRVVRQQQRVTDRTLSRQEQQRTDRMEQAFEQQIRQTIHERDSVWQECFAQFTSSMRDSLRSVRDLQQQRSASNPLTWWQQFRLHLANIMLWLLLIAAAVWLIKKRFHILS